MAWENDTADDSEQYSGDPCNTLRHIRLSCLVCNGLLVESCDAEIALTLLSHQNIVRTRDLGQVFLSEPVRSHQVLSRVHVEWQIQDGYQAEAASFIVDETEKTKQSKTKMLGSSHLLKGRMFGEYHITI